MRLGKRHLAAHGNPADDSHGSDAQAGDPDGDQQGGDQQGAAPPAMLRSEDHATGTLRLGGLELPARTAVPALLAALVAVTVAGVVLGRVIGSHAVAREPLPTASSTPPQPTTSHRSKPPVRPNWGPLTVHPFGRLPAGVAVTGVLVSGDRLTVIGAALRGAVYTGRAGTALAQTAQLPYRLTGAAAVPTGGSVLLVGGIRGSAAAGQSATPTAEILELRLHAAELVTGRTFTEPLANAGVLVQPGGALLVGGFTGDRYATAVLRFTPPDGSSLVARLPDGVGSAAVARVGSTVYVAGGRTQSGLSRAVYAVDTATGTVRTLGRLPRPVEQAVLVRAGASLYLLGGRAPSGRALSEVVRIDPRTGKTSRAGSMPRPLAGATTVPFGRDTLVLGAPSGVIYRIRGAG